MSDVQELLIQRPEGQRRALLRMPAAGGDVRAVVMLLHGAGGTAKLALANTGWTELADREGLLLVYPEGTRRDPAAPPMFLQNPQAWNDGSGRGHTARTGVDDVGFLTALLDEVVDSHNVDPSRLYLAGFSNGASMTFRAGVALAGTSGGDWSGRWSLLGVTAGLSGCTPRADDLRRARSAQPGRTGER